MDLPGCAKAFLDVGGLDDGATRRRPRGVGNGECQAALAIGTGTIVAPTEGWRLQSSGHLHAELSARTCRVVGEGLWDLLEGVGALNRDTEAARDDLLGEPFEGGGNGAGHDRKGNHVLTRKGWPGRSGAPAAVAPDAAAGYGAGA